MTLPHRQRFTRVRQTSMKLELKLRRLPIGLPFSSSFGVPSSLIPVALKVEEFELASDTIRLASNGCMKEGTRVPPSC